MSRANTGALIRPAQKVVGDERFAQAVRELRQRDVQVEQRQQASAGEPHGIGNDGQQRQCDDEGEHPRHDQHFDRIHAHGAQRVGFLIELHDADFRGESTAGAAGDDDRRQQYAHFAQHRNRHQIDDEDIGAEPRELLRPQIGDDHADQKGDQRDDGNGRDAGFVDMPRNRRYAQRPQPRETWPSTLRCGRRSRARRVLRLPCSTVQRPELARSRSLRCSAQLTARLVARHPVRA